MAEQPDRPLAAALWMGGTITGFSAMAVAGRELSGHLDTFEIMFWRSLIALVAVLAVTRARGRMHEISTARLPVHLARNVAHFTGQNLWLLALGLIPLAQVFALEFSYPILVALTAPLLLGERFRAVKLVSALVGFAGILIVARPFGGAGLSVGLIAALGAAVGFAATAIFTKRLTRTVGVHGILFWLCLMQTIFALVLMLADGQARMPQGTDWRFLFVIGLGSLVAHGCLTTALSLAPASVVVPIEFLRLPIIAVVAMLLYGEALDVWVLVGGAVIFLGNWLNLAMDARASRRAESPAQRPAKNPAATLPSGGG